MAEARIAGSARFDVTRGFRYKVSFAQPVDVSGDAGPAPELLPAGFQSVTGLSAEAETVEYREGTDEIAMRKFMGLLAYGTVTLNKGVDPKGLLHAWFQFCHGTGVGGKFVNDAVGAEVDGPGRKREGGRRDVTIVVFDRSGVNTPRTIVLRNAWPKAFEYGDLDASSSDVLVETLTLEFEGYEVENQGGQVTSVTATT